MDIIKQDMTDIWAVAGDVVAPESAKVRAGWAVEAVPRQWWNWFENRQDTNIAYMLQKGIPEWDQFTEYLTNKSYVQRNNIVYKCILTATNQDPTTATTYWVKAFPESSIGLETLKGVVPATDTFPYFTGTNTAAVTGLSAFMRTVLDDVDAATARATLGAQQADATLTALAGLATATNKLPYFTGTDVAALTDFTAFARTLLDDADAATMRATLGVYSTTDADAGLAAGLATKQPLATNLTNLAALAITNNTMPFYNGTSVLGLTAVTTYGRGFLNLADAAASRTYIGADDASNLTTGTIPLARIPTNLTGVNAATATKLQTARTIQGIAFDGTANITLSVVDKDSAVGSAVMPAGTSAQRTASPANGMLRYNNETNEFEGFQNGAWAGIGGGTPLYTVLWWPNRASIPAGYIPADGQLLTRTTYQAAFAGVNSGVLPVVSDTVWLANSTSRGCYTPGDGSTTFRIPDLNGKFSGTVAAPFLRGDGTNSAGTPGTFQSDAYQSHTHAVNISAVSGTTAGLVTFNTGNNATANYATISSSGREATETRPVNVTGVFIIKLIGGASELSQDDASLAVAALDNKLAYVSGRNRLINGDCRIQQRSNVSVTPGTSAYGGPDRYVAINGGATGGTFSQASGTIVIDGVNTTCVAHNVTTPPSNLTSTNYFGGIAQVIEGYNCYDLSGKPVTLSFVFITPVSGTYSVGLRNGGGTHSYVTTFTAVAGIQQKVVISVPAIPSAASIPNSTGGGLIVNIGALNFGTYQAPTLNGWVSGNYFAASTNTIWATGTNYIAATNIQLEQGTVATPFERKLYGEQLLDCQRYYAIATSTARWPAYAAGQLFSVPVQFPAQMRATPTMTFLGSTTSSNISTVTASASNTVAGLMTLLNSATGDTYVLGGNWGCNAEL